MSAARAADVRRIAQIAATAAAALIALGATRLPTQAATNRVLVIPASDGYGFDDCLSGNKACGHTIADAWCEAHGMSAAASFGRAEDVTASVALSPTAAKAGSAPARYEQGSFVVTCRD